MFRVMQRMSVGVLVLAAAGTLAAGVVSYWHGLPEDTLWIPMVTTKKEVRAAMVRGTLHVVYSSPTSQPAASVKTEKRFGPFYMKHVTFGATTAGGVGAPFWSIAAAALVYPAMALAAGPLRRRRRRRRNQCIHCGYSLEGLTERRCPECGRGF